MRTLFLVAMLSAVSRWMAITVSDMAVGDPRRPSTDPPVFADPATDLPPKGPNADPPVGDPRGPNTDPLVYADPASDLPPKGPNARGSVFGPRGLSSVPGAGLQRGLCSHILVLFCTRRRRPLCKMQRERIPSAPPGTKRLPAQDEVRRRVPTHPPEGDPLGTVRNGCIPRL